MLAPMCLSALACHLGVYITSAGALYQAAFQHEVPPSSSQCWQNKMLLLLVVAWYVRSKLQAYCINQQATVRINVTSSIVKFDMLAV